MAKPEDTTAAKPYVPVRVIGAASEPQIDAVVNGLEEEGIPFWVESVRGDIIQAARAGALASPLNVSVGIDGNQKTAVLHHRDLPPGEPLLQIAPEAFTAEELRRLGTNAARLVKGNPLVFETPAPVETFPQAAPKTTPNMKNPGSESNSDRLDEIVSQVLRALKKDVSG
jgi:hypothetical protein